MVSVSGGVTTRDYDGCRYEAHNLKYGTVTTVTLLDDEYSCYPKWDDMGAKAITVYNRTSLDP